MNPDIKTVIYGTIISVIATALGYLIKLLLDKLNNKKKEPIDRGKQITELADAMVEVSTKAVNGIRGELEEALESLKGARRELKETKAQMEELEEAHLTAVGKLQRRVRQLVKVLTDNNLEVPPESD